MLRRLRQHESRVKPWRRRRHKSRPNATHLNSVRVAAVAWLLTAVFYFYQYALRSAPAVMMPQLSEAFGLTTLGVASMVGLFYYGYSPFSLVAGAAMDRLGPRQLLPFAAVVVGIGALLFATGQRETASVGRFLQGAGGVFALVGADLHCYQELSCLAGSDADRRHADVWDGRRLRRTVPGGTVDRSRPELEQLLDRDGYRRNA